MRWYANEVAPAAPLLIPLGEIALWAIAFAVCMAVVYFAKAFFGVTGNLLGKLPIVGGWLDAGAHAIEQRITNTFAAAAATCDAKMGAALHSLARFVDKLGAEIVRHANLLLALAQLIPGVSAIETFARELLGLKRLAVSLVHRIEGIGHDVFIRVGHIERGIGADVLPRICSLERTVARDFARERARARTAERTLDREITNLWKWTRTHPWTVVTDAFVAAVAVALAKLGLDWIKCDSAKSVAKRRGCGMWNDLDALLGLAAGTLVIADLKDLVREAQKVERVAVEAIEALLKV